MRQNPGPLSRLLRAITELPLPVGSMVVSAVLLGALGGVVGLVLGLASHPPTAWFAVLEVGVPAGLVGGVLGLVAGSAAYALRAGASGRRLPR